MFDFHNELVMVTNCTAVSASAVMSVTNIFFLKVELHGFIVYLEFSQVFKFGASIRNFFGQFFQSLFCCLFVPILKNIMTYQK